MEIMILTHFIAFLLGGLVVFFTMALLVAIAEYKDMQYEKQMVKKFKVKQADKESHSFK